MCPVEKDVPRENLHVFGRYCIATIKVGRDKAHSTLFCMVHTRVWQGFMVIMCFQGVDHHLSALLTVILHNHCHFSASHPPYPHIGPYPLPLPHPAPSPPPPSLASDPYLYTRYFPQYDDTPGGKANKMGVHLGIGAVQQKRRGNIQVPEFPMIRPVFVKKWLLC